MAFRKRCKVKPPQDPLCIGTKALGPMQSATPIGVLYGREETFPLAVVHELNSRGQKIADAVSLGGLFPLEGLQHRVIIDRISHQIPYYQALLRQHSWLGGASLPDATITEKFDRLVVAQAARQLGLRYLETVALPTKDHPPGVVGEDLGNLVYPLGWEGILERVGFPACFRPLRLEGRGYRRVHSLRELWDVYGTTGNELQVLQSSPDSEHSLMVLIIGEEAAVLAYQPGEDRYLHGNAVHPACEQALIEDSRSLLRRCGLEMGGVEWTMRGDQGWFVDLHLSPNLDWWSLGEGYFDRMVKATAALALKTLDSLAPSRMQPPAKVQAVTKLSEKPASGARKKPARSAK